MRDLPEKKLLSIEATSAALGLAPVTVRMWAAARKIASVKLGRRRLILSSEIDRLIERNLIPALPERDGR